MGGAGELQAMQNGRATAAMLFGSHQTAANLEDNKQSCMLSLFRADQAMTPNGKALQKEHEFAFDNPYFRDEASANQQRYLRSQQLQQNVGGAIHKSTTVGGGLLQTANDEFVADSRGNHLAGNEQLHFIEHHISNLHNKQVTSSVKELSILGRFWKCCWAK